jgi:flagellar biogenesis protein FliO
MEFARQLVIVALFLGALLAAAQLIRRRGGIPLRFPTRNHRVRQLEAIEKLPLTPTHSLHLVRVAGRDLLIGVSPSGCSLLDAKSPETSSRGEAA